ncbi:hypothetical protein [Haloglomus halophilum]|uniref:hypothetical protein n=1 Tax=Haloglomus halophilum TaxID=2962672 RepID=UPI0020C99D8A|nr:hypothetical protein [Haloglomus halophilum]
MSDETEVRDILLSHSDQQPVRNVFQAVTDGGGDADLSDHIETMRATDGELALVAQDGAADVYARWSGSRFELLTVWPPWTVTGYDTTDRAGLEDRLDGLVALRPMAHDGTPFASPGTLNSLRGLTWP